MVVELLQFETVMYLQLNPLQIITKFSLYLICHRLSIKERRKSGDAEVSGSTSAARLRVEWIISEYWSGRNNNNYISFALK